MSVFLKVGDGLFVLKGFVSKKTVLREDKYDNLLII